MVDARTTQGLDLDRVGAEGDLDPEARAATASFARCATSRHGSVNGDPLTL